MTLESQSHFAPPSTLTSGVTLPSRNDSSNDTSPRTSSIAEYLERKLEKEESRHDISTTKEGPDFPDGGLQAWLVVFGGVCLTFSTFGFVNSWGVYQAYYQENLLKDSSPSNIAWIGSIQYCLIFLPGILVGRLFDLGYFRSIFLSSSAILVAAAFLVAECRVYWHFLLCQGFAAGIGCGGLFGPMIAIVAHWFKRRRGIALGIVATGSSIGGTVIPIVIRSLLGRIGFKWTVRVVAFILLLALGCTNLTMRRRLPPSNLKGGLLNLRAFRSAPFTIYCLAAFVVFLGLYTVLTYLSVDALQIGFSQDFSFHLVSFANAASLVGRLSCGLVADRLGSTNVMMPFTAAAGLLTYAWPYARSKPSLILVAMIYGFSSGAYVALLANPMIDLGPTEDVGRRIGMLTSIFALGAVVGPPLSGAIRTSSGGFEAVGFYAGTVIMLGVALMFITRLLVLRQLVGKF